MKEQLCPGHFLLLKACQIILTSSRTKGTAQSLDTCTCPDQVHYWAGSLQVRKTFWANFPVLIDAAAHNCAQLSLPATICSGHHVSASRASPLKAGVNTLHWARWQQGLNFHCMWQRGMKSHICFPWCLSSCPCCVSDCTHFTAR